MSEVSPISRCVARLPCVLSFSPVVKRIAAFFDNEYSHGSGVDAYLVGGILRDTLMGRGAEDVDIAVSADAGRVGRNLAAALDGHYVPLHDEDKWQVARVVLRDSGVHRYIDIATIHGDIEQDLRKRDFTINAMALPINEALSNAADMCLLDPCGGLRDLRDRVVRMVSPDALDEDCVRLMRAARLATKFGFSLSDETFEAVSVRASRITTAPQERVRDELMRLLGTPNAREGVRLLDDLGLLCSIIPELMDSKGVTQPKEHYWDVFNHLVEAVGWIEVMFSPDRGLEAGDLPLDELPCFEGMTGYFGREVSDGFDRLTFLKLTALLHDIAKPATKTIEDSGRIRFLGHHSEGADMVRKILRRLRFGKRGVSHVAAMVQLHLRPRQMAQKDEMPTRRALYRYYRDAGDIALDTLYLNMADYLAARGPMLARHDWEGHCELIRYILEENRREDAPQSVPVPVTGYDIMDKFALAPGPIIGRVLEIVREAYMNGEITTKEQALELVSASLERGGAGCVGTQER